MRRRDGLLPAGLQIVGHRGHDSEIIEAAIEIERHKQNQTISRTTKMNETRTKENQTPYSAWLQTEILHTLQQTVSNHPGEYAFLINAQVQELYWALIVREMQAAQARLREDNLVEAHEALLRVVDHHEPLNATWRSLSWITPSDMMPILAAVRATYGRDTALQGWTYRHMVYLFGIKQEQHLEHFEPQLRIIYSRRRTRRC
jgi:tryptophan 2,3-dioxygenase